MSDKLGALRWSSFQELFGKGEAATNISMSGGSQGSSCKKLFQWRHMVERKLDRRSPGAMKEDDEIENV